MIVRKRKRVEHDIHKIYKYFIGPLVLRHKPRDLPIADFMANTVFDIKNREIFRFITTSHFKMPGILFAAPSVKIQGIGYRHVKQGQILYVRMDRKRPEQIDVEILAGPGKRDQTFELTSWEFATIRPLLRDTEVKCENCAETFFSEQQQVYALCAECLDARAND